jgi:hypothetical protein
MLWFPFCRCEEVLGGPPTIVAIDINGKKTNRFLSIHFNEYRDDQFTKTGLGQTQETHTCTQRKSLFLMQATAPLTQS